VQSEFISSVSLRVLQPKHIKAEPKKVNSPFYERDCVVVGGGRVCAPTSALYFGVALVNGC
jgi:hypothetical protein